MTFFSQLELHAERGLQAVVSDTSCLTYAELLGRVEREADALAAAGVVPGAVVGINITGEIEHFVASLALLKLGAWQFGLASHDTSSIHSELASRLGMTMMVTDGTSSPPAGVMALPWPLPPGGVAGTRADGGGFYFRTSGTTGASNLVPLPVDALAAQARRNPEYASSRYLRLASIEHNNGKRHRLFCAFVGGTNVFGDVDRKALAAFCARRRVTRMDISSMHAADLVATAAPADFAGVEIYVAGSASPFSLRSAIEQRVTQHLYTRYATTEFGTIAICRPGEHDERELAGRPVAGVELQIVDEDGQRLPAGEVGQIRMRGEGMARSYYDSPDQTTRRFRDGWFWPGDIGQLTQDDYLTVRGRADEMIILNGINIFPAEIERVLSQHPEVHASAATALTSAIHGQIPVAAVEVVAGATVTPRDLLTFARERLALRAPRKIIIVAKLPRNGQGKLVRREVAQMFDTHRGSH